MVDDLSQVVEYGNRFEVIVGSQNHGEFLKTLDETVELFMVVNSKWLRINVDTGYFLAPDPYIG